MGFLFIAFSDEVGAASPPSLKPRSGNPQESSGLLFLGEGVGAFGGFFFEAELAAGGIDVVAFFEA